MIALSVCTRREVDCSLFVCIVSMYKNACRLYLVCLHCQFVQEGRWTVTCLFSLSVCTRTEAYCNLVVCIVSMYKNGGGSTCYRQELSATCVRSCVTGAWWHGKCISIRTGTSALLLMSSTWPSVSKRSGQWT